MEQQEMALFWAIGLAWKSVCFTPLNFIPQERFSRSRLKGFSSQKSSGGRVLTFSTWMESSLSLNENPGMPVRLRSSENVSRLGKGFRPQEGRQASGSILLWLT